MMTEQELLALAQRVLAEGRAFCESWSHEGTPESGPSGGSTPVVALGKLRLEVTRNGSCILRDERGIYHTIFGTHAGSGHWGGTGPTFWVHKERQAIRDQVVARANPD